MTFGVAVFLDKELAEKARVKPQNCRVDMKFDSVGFQFCIRCDAIYCKHDMAIRSRIPHVRHVRHVGVFRVEVQY